MNAPIPTETHADLTPVCTCGAPTRSYFAGSPVCGFNRPCATVRIREASELTRRDDVVGPPLWSVTA
jgi:hypothetical protein